jgi:hypothetical protein
MSRPTITTITGFYDQHGTWRELRDPDGPPTARQLMALHRAGALRLAPLGSSTFTKAQAASLIDSAHLVGLLQPRPTMTPEERFDRVCGEIVRHVQRHPGCTLGGVTAAVHARHGYATARVTDLIELGVIEDRAPRHGQGIARSLYHRDGNAGDER